MYTISEIRVYTTPNLFYKGATILEAPDPVLTSKNAENLVTNLRVRSPRNEFNPIIDAEGNRSQTIESCFVTTEKQLASSDHIFVLGFDLGEPMM